MDMRSSHLLPVTPHLESGGELSSASSDQSICLAILIIRSHQNPFKQSAVGFPTVSGGTRKPIVDVARTRESEAGCPREAILGTLFPFLVGQAVPVVPVYAAALETAGYIAGDGEPGNHQC